jgi:hypothetical protein
MDRIWKKLILRIKDESYREQVYWWFQDQKPYGFWEKDSLTIVAYVRDWPEESFPEYIVAAERDEEPDENWECIKWIALKIYKRKKRLHTFLWKSL